MSSEKQWKLVAVNLAKALRRTPFYECGGLDHSGGLFHDGDSPCPVVKICDDALREFDDMMDDSK